MLDLFVIRRAFLFVLGLGTFAGLAAQTVRDPLVYKRPHEVGIDVAALAAAERALAGPNPDCAGIRESMAREIAKFTTQFVADKRIQEERRTSQYDPRRLDKNTVRLLALARSQEFDRVDFLGESPLMYRLHSLLGRCYEKEESPYRALSEYAMAMRYSTFEQPFGPPPVKQAASELSGEPLALREDRYLLMLEGFANTERLEQIADANEKQAGEAFRQTLAAYHKAKLESEQARQRIDAFIARRARGDTTVDPARARAEFEQLDARRIELLARLESDRLGAYRTYNRRRSARDGDTAYRMALLVKELETRNKKLDRVLNRSSFYRGRGDSSTEESTALRRFVGYGLMLELANKLDPENSQYVSLLAEEYRTSRLYERAIAFEERFLELRRETPGVEAELAQHYRRLGGLFTDTRNYIRAVQAYEESLRLAPDAPDADQLRLLLADIMFARTGDFERAAELYYATLARLSNTDTATLGLRQFVEHHAIRFRVLRNVASIEEKRRRTEREQANLIEAGTSYLALEERLRALETEKAQLQVRINGLKKSLLDREDTQLQLEYYRLLRRDLPDIQDRVAHVQTHLGALNLPVVLERRALIAFRKGDLSGALVLYRDIVARGDGAQQTRARQNMSRLRRTLTDGLTRNPILPPSL